MNQGEQLGGGNYRYLKFGKEEGKLPKGSVVRGVVTQLAFDVEGAFGPESYVVLDDGGDGQPFIRLPTSLRNVLREAAPRIVVGQTELVITYDGVAQPKKGGKPYHAFRVEAFGLAPKGGKVQAAKPGADEPADPDDDIPF